MSTFTPEIRYMLTAREALEVKPELTSDTLLDISSSIFIVL